MRRSLVAAAALFVSVLSPGMAHAESAPGCGPVTQIGDTAYVGWEIGARWASVKQFKGCGKNWAYMYVWDSYHNQGNDYYLTIGVETASGTKGRKQGRNRQQELWSSGTDTLSVCTQAKGYLVDNPDFASSATTAKRC